MNMLDVIRSRDNRKVIDAMIEGRDLSVWSIVKHERGELEFDKGAIKVLHPDSEFPTPVIRVEVFLDTMLDIDDDFAQEANELLYSLEKDDSDKAIELLKERYPDDVDDNGYLTVTGYTYNIDNDLSRDITYHIFTYEGDHYAFITVHHGADARVGFGPMVCFKVIDIDYFFIGMEFTVYDSVTDEDYDRYSLEDIAYYDNQHKEWRHKETGNEIYLHTPADGF